jgi:hypothetical protein
MKKLILLSFLVFNLYNVNAQNGLENVIVETYYISDGNDTSVNATGGVLPVGSVTYRIYADMLPGYRFQAAYGVTGHPMRIQTSTLFFNNEFLGSSTPGSIPKSFCGQNTVMLDSWLSVGQGCVNNYGVLKSMDNGVATVTNIDGVLQNNAPAMGIPLTQQDGFMNNGQAGAPQSVTFVGITASEFDAQNDGTNGPLFFTDNGSWASLNGSVGHDTTENKVLIAQITTDGTFEFELNIQIGTPLGLTENYVAANPVGSEIQAPFLTYASNKGFTMYPNPAHDNITLVTNKVNDGTGFYSIYSVDGRVIRHVKFDANQSSETKVDVSDMAAGQYIMGVFKDGRSSAAPFIKY